ncbi:hypothetical protein KH5_21380 [Urechidicola sp. KH5]
MSFKINYLDNSVIATFEKEIKKDELIHAFVEIIETVRISKLSKIIYDCTATEKYTPPIDYLEKLQIVTQYTSSWNSNVDIICVTAQPDLASMVKSIMKHQDKLVWSYHLYENMDEIEFLNNLTAISK